MHPFWAFLIIACILVPLFYALHDWGIMVTRSTTSFFRTETSLPARWEGHTAETSGFMRRNFVMFQKYHSLAIETKTNSGTLNVEVKGPDGSILSPVPSACSRDGSALIDVSQFKRCSVMLKMDRFNGEFHITLQ